MSTFYFALRNVSFRQNFYWMISWSVWSALGVRNTRVWVCSFLLARHIQSTTCRLFVRLDFNVIVKFIILTFVHCILHNIIKLICRAEKLDENQYFTFRSVSPQDEIFSRSAVREALWLEKSEQKKRFRFVFGVRNLLIDPTRVEQSERMKEIVEFLFFERTKVKIAFFLFCVEGKMFWRDEEICRSEEKRRWTNWKCFRLFDKISSRTKRKRSRTIGRWISTETARSFDQGKSSNKNASNSFLDSNFVAKRIFEWRRKSFAREQQKRRTMGRFVIDRPMFFSLNWK